MNTYDVAIIGAGVIGASIARELSRYKLNIAVFEKEAECGFGVSKSNSGIIHPGTQNPPNSLKGRLCVQGNILTRSIAGELGVDFQEVGELIVIFDERDLPRLLELKREAEALAVPELRIVDRGWLRENEPNLSAQALLALYAPTAGIISPYRLVYALCENAVRNGVEIHTQAKVENIVSFSSTRRQNARFEIVTLKGTFRARYVINAAGLYADDISRMAGIDDFTIRPRKGEEFILDKKKQNLTRHLIFPLPSKTSKGILVIKTADGNPMVGPTAEDVGDKNELSTTGEGLKKVFSSVKKLVPAIDEADIIAYFAGLRPVAGEDFIIRYGDKALGFINVAGIQSPGLTAAPAIARLVRAILKKNGLNLRKKIIFHSKRKKPIHLFTPLETTVQPENTKMFLTGFSIPLAKTQRFIRKDASFGDIVCRCELVSAREVSDAIAGGARTLDGIKFRTRAQAGRCHGAFCTTRLMKILSQETNIPLTAVTKRGPGSEIVKKDRNDA